MTLANGLPQPKPTAFSCDKCERTSDKVSRCAMCGLWLCAKCRIHKGTTGLATGTPKAVFWCGDKECEEGVDKQCGQ